MVLRAKKQSHGSSLSPFAFWAISCTWRDFNFTHSVNHGFIMFVQLRTWSAAIDFAGKVFSAGSLLPSRRVVENTRTQSTAAFNVTRLSFNWIPEGVEGVTMTTAAAIDLLDMVGTVRHKHTSACYSRWENQLKKKKIKLVLHGTEAP